MTTTDARLTYDYALRDAALERIRRLKDLGRRVQLTYFGENLPVRVWHTSRRGGGVVIALARYTDARVMEREYERLIRELASLLENIEMQRAPTVHQDEPFCCETCRQWGLTR